MVLGTHSQFKVFEFFFKAKHTNGQTLHTPNISSAFKYLAPSSHPLKAGKFTGNDIPVLPNISTAERMYSAFISCHLVNGALITKLKMQGDGGMHAPFWIAP